MAATDFFQSWRILVTATASVAVAVASPAEPDSTLLCLEPVPSVAAAVTVALPAAIAIVTKTIASKESDYPHDRNQQPLGIALSIDFSQCPSHF